MDVSGRAEAEHFHGNRPGKIDSKYTPVLQKEAKKAATLLSRLMRK
jgi:hypothetical protein